MLRTLIPGFFKIAAIPAAGLAKTSFVFVTLTNLLTHFTYLALVLTLVVAGAGVPIPEDIPLIFSGYLCNKHHSPIKDLTVMIDSDKDGIKETEIPRHVPNLYLMMAAGMFGVLLGDSIVFTIGRRGIESNNLIARHLRKVMHSKRREKVERHFAKHGHLTVFVGRFMPGFRSIVFAFAGLSKMSYVRFLIIDGMAAAISVPFFIFLGWHFAEHIATVLLWIDRIKLWLLPVVIVGLAILVIVYLRRRAKPQPQPVVDARAIDP